MPQSKVCNYRIGTDIGGTFTDIVVITDDGRAIVRKVLSTIEDYAQGITTTLKELLTTTNLSSSAAVDMVHGTTVATNAILESKGAKTGLITTKGFRDILEIRRPSRSPEDIFATLQIPKPLVPRRFRLEVDERIDWKGKVLRPLNLHEVRSVLQKFADNGIESVAVCLLNSFVNPEHEQKVAQLMQQEFPQFYSSLSSELSPQIGEYERTSTVVVNAYVMGVVHDYLESLITRLKNIRITAPVLVMESSGGSMSANVIEDRPVHMIESGPSAGVVASAALAKRLSFDKVISLDMGGTTAKASLIDKGEISRRFEFDVGGGITMGARLKAGKGYIVSLPAIDIAEVGAGGGSIIWRDAGGLMQVGPASAGAFPGPACYDIGGTEPTATDANVVLGYLNPEYIAGGNVRINLDKALAVMEERVAKLFGLSTLEAAYGAHLISNANMGRAIKAISSERGENPRDYILFAFGGAGPVHAVNLARSLNMRRVLVPPAAGVFSGFGLLLADIEHSYSKTLLTKVDDLDFAVARQMFHKMEEEALATLKTEGYQPGEVIMRRFTDLRYVGQSSSLLIEVPLEVIDREDTASLKDAFFAKYQTAYGHVVNEPTELVNLRLTAIASHPIIPLNKLRLETDISHKAPKQMAIQKRKAYFGPEFGLLDAPVLGRNNLTHRPTNGPLIIEEYDTTTVVLPGCKAYIDDFMNIIVDIETS
jgi:N-methylhydantoinase A